MDICWKAWPVQAVAIAGAGTIQPIKKTAASLEQMKKQAPFEESMDTVYDAMLPILEKL